MVKINLENPIEYEVYYDDLGHTENRIVHTTLKKTYYENFQDISFSNVFCSNTETFFLNEDYVSLIKTINFLISFYCRNSYFLLPIKNTAFILLPPILKAFIWMRDKNLIDGTLEDLSKILEFDSIYDLISNWNITKYPDLPKEIKRSIQFALHNEILNEQEIKNFSKQKARVKYNKHFKIFFDIFTYTSENLIGKQIYNSGNQLVMENWKFNI